MQQSSIMLDNIDDILDPVIALQAKIRSIGSSIKKNTFVHIVQIV